MAAYCVMNIQKHNRQAVKGLQMEANREMDTEKYKNNVNPEKTDQNIYLRKSSNWLQDINTAIKNANIKKVRKDAILSITGLYTASPTWFAQHTQQEMINYFESCVKFHNENYGQVISAVIHLDETTPHLHICSVPITQDNRLCAKDLVGNKGKLHDLQSKFYEECGKSRGLQRGEERSAEARRKHLDEQEHAIKKNQEKIESQTAEMEIREEILSDQTAILKDLQQDKDNLEAEIEVAKKSRKKLDNDNLKIAGEIEDTSQRQDALLEQMQLVLSELDKLEAEKNKMQEEIHENESQAKAAEIRLAKVRENIVRLKFEPAYRVLDELQRKIDDLEYDKDHIAEKLAKLQDWMQSTPVPGRDMTVMQLYQSTTQTREHDHNEERLIR